MANSKKIIGAVNVDTGTLLLADPITCDYEVAQKLASKGNLHSWDKKHGIVVLATGWGDGNYPVTATLTPDGRIAKIEVEFMAKHNGQWQITGISMNN